jgi:triosephosphate isomerase
MTTRKKSKMRKTIIAGNWKLNKKIKDALELVTALKRGLSDVTEIDMVVWGLLPARSPRA